MRRLPLPLAAALVLSSATSDVSGQDPPAPSGEADVAEPARPEPARPEPARPPQPETPPRPGQLRPLPPRPELSWGRNVEIGGDVAFVGRTADAADGSTDGIAYDPTVGFGIHARWDVLRYLRFTAYFVDARHDVVLPRGSLGLDAELELPPVYTFVFGAKLGPMLRLGERARVWLSIGVGYGRLEFDKMKVTESGGSFMVRERDDPFVEIPFSGGVSFDIIRNWLTAELEISGAWVDNQDGDALGTIAAQDYLGHRRTVGAFPGIGNSFVQTLGLSLVL